MGLLRYTEKSRYLAFMSHCMPFFSLSEVSCIGKTSFRLTTLLPEMFHVIHSHYSVVNFNLKKHLNLLSVHKGGVGDWEP